MTRKINSRNVSAFSADMSKISLTSGFGHAFPPDERKRDAAMNSKYFGLFLGVGVAATLGLFSTGVHADVITTGQFATQTSGSGINDNADLITVGSGYYAANFGINSNETVGGITFAGFSSVSGTGSGGNITVAGWSHDYADYFGTGTSTTVTTGDASLDAVLNTGIYNTSAQNESITFNNLTTGNSYEAQFLIADNRSGESGHSMQIANNETYSTGSGDYAPTVLYDNDGDDYVGAYIDWTFTATGTTQTFYNQLLPIPQGGHSGSQINAAIITPLAASAPTPATLGLVAMGAMGLLLLKAPTEGLTLRGEFRHQGTEALHRMLPLVIPACHQLFSAYSASQHNTFLVGLAVLGNLHGYGHIFWQRQAGNIETDGINASAKTA